MEKRTRRPRRKIPILMESGYPIRIYPTGKKRYVSDIWHQGVRERVYHLTENHARQYCIKKAGEVAHEGARAISLTSEQREDALRAIKKMGDTATLEAAADFFMRHTVAGEAGKPVKDVVADLMTAKRGANRRPATILDAEHRLNRFVKSFGERPLGTITLHDLEHWLAGLNVQAVTRDNFRRAVVGLFNYGMKRGLCERNPANGLAISGRDDSMPTILTPKQTAALLTAAKAHAPEMVPYFAIGLFAGLRPKNELTRLAWTNIDLKAKTIRVDPATAKRRRSRFVELSPNLTAWIAPHMQTTGTIFYSRRKFRTVVTKAGISEWPPDIMRHSFASYHLAAHGDANATALQLGHTGAPGVLFDHYRALAQAKDARTYWKIAPPQKQVVHFPKAKSAQEKILHGPKCPQKSRCHRSVQKRSLSQTQSFAAEGGRPDNRKNRSG